MEKFDYFNLFFLIILFLFLFIPIIYMLISPGNIVNAINNTFIESFKNTILAGIVSTLLALFFCVPAGYFLARNNFKFKNFIEGIIDLPMAIPHSVIGIIILSSIYGISFLSFTQNYIIDNFWGIVVVYLFVGIPYMLSNVKDGFLSVDENLEHVSRTLGASKIKTFFEISLPLIKPNLISGIILCFARGISEVGAILIVAYYPKTVPVLILEEFTSFGIDYSKPIAVIMILFSMILFIILRKFGQVKSN